MRKPPRVKGLSSFDAAKVAGAYKKVRSALAKDPLFLRGAAKVGVSLGELDERMRRVPKSSADLLAWLDGPDQYRYAGLAVLFATYGRSARAARVAGPLHLAEQQTLVVAGDLHVQGNVVLEDSAALFVLGSLVIDGWLGHVGDFSVVAAQEMAFASGVTTGELIALASIRGGAKLYLAHNDHSCRAPELSAELLVDFERDNAFTKVTAAHRLTAWDFREAARALGVSPDVDLAPAFLASLERPPAEPAAAPLDDEDLCAAARTSAPRLAKLLAPGHPWSAPQLAVALVYAAQWQQPACVRLLLDAGARDDQRWALVAAVESPAALELLLAFHQAGPDIVIDERPLLHHAIGSEAGVAWLVKHGVNLDAAVGGATALHLCAQRGYVKQAKLLVGAGARTDVATTAPSDSAKVGDTPLDIANAQVVRQRRAGYPPRPWELLVSLLSSTPRKAARKPTKR